MSWSLWQSYLRHLGYRYAYEEHATQRHALYGDRRGREILVNRFSNKRGLAAFLREIAIDDLRQDNLIRHLIAEGGVPNVTRTASRDAVNTLRTANRDEPTDLGNARWEGRRIRLSEDLLRKAALIARHNRGLGMRETFCRILAEGVAAKSAQGIIASMPAREDDRARPSRARL